MTRLRLFTIILIYVSAIAGIKFALAQIPNQESDSDILGVVSIIDQNEIQAAQLALQKHTNQNVLDYAKMLNEEHTKNLVALQQLSRESNITVAINTSVINQLQNKNELDMMALTKLDGDSFAQLYVADMIKGHSDALNWIDSQKAQNKEVKDFLKDTSHHIVMHFKKAQDIQKDQKIGQT